MTLNQEDFNVVIGGRLDALRLEPSDILVVTVTSHRSADDIERIGRSFKHWTECNDIQNKFIIVSEGIEVGMRSQQITSQQAEIERLHGEYLKAVGDRNTELLANQFKFARYEAVVEAARALLHEVDYPGADHMVDGPEADVLRDALAALEESS